MSGALSKAKPRQVADPSVTVGDLMEPLESFLETTGEKNVMKHLQPPPNTSWKTSTPITWLAGLATLFEDYLKVAPNAIISSKKHKTAIIRLEEKHRINFSKKNTDEFADLIDDFIRMGLSHLRSLKQQPEKKEQAFRRADKEQQKTLSHVIDLIRFDVEHQDDSQGSQHEQGPKQLAMVPFEQDHPEDVQTHPSSGSKEHCKAPPMAGDALAVFDRVLQTHQSDEAEIPITLLKSSRGHSTPAPKTESPPKKHPIKLVLTPEEEEIILRSAANASPICKDGKSQNQRFNAQKAKNKKKGKGKGKKSDRETEEGEEENKEETRTQPKKRPSAAGDSRASKSQKKDESESLEHLLKELDFRFEAVPGPDKLPRKQRRNQHTSRAYHRTQDFLVRQGYSKEVAQEEARRQSRKAGAWFDERWPLGSEVVFKKPAMKGKKVEPEELEEEELEEGEELEELEEGEADEAEEEIPIPMKKPSAKKTKKKTPISKEHDDYETPAVMKKPSQKIKDPEHTPEAQEPLRVKSEPEDID